MGWPRGSYMPGTIILFCNSFYSESNGSTGLPVINPLMHRHNQDSATAGMQGMHREHPANGLHFPPTTKKITNVFAFFSIPFKLASVLVSRLSL